VVAQIPDRNSPIDFHRITGETRRAVNRSADLRGSGAAYKLGCATLLRGRKDGRVEHRNDGRENKWAPPRRWLQDGIKRASTMGLADYLDAIPALGSSSRSSGVLEPATRWVSITAVRAPPSV